MLRLTDEQRDRIQDPFPDETLPENCLGRKSVADREVLEGALSILNTGAQWHLLPPCYPNYKRCIGATACRVESPHMRLTIMQ